MQLHLRRARGTTSIEHSVVLAGCHPYPTVLLAITHHRWDPILHPPASAICLTSSYPHQLEVEVETHSRGCRAGTNVNVTAQFNIAREWESFVFTEDVGGTKQLDTNYSSLFDHRKIQQPPKISYHTFTTMILLESGS